MRLAVLPASLGTVHDPRPAASLLHDLDVLEERLLRHEASLGARPLRRSAIGEIGGVILSAMREEVDRNAGALAGCSLADLPDLILTSQRWPRPTAPILAICLLYRSVRRSFQACWPLFSQWNWNVMDGGQPTPLDRDLLWSGTSESSRRNR
jgi:hypothetical protein